MKPTPWSDRLKARLEDRTRWVWRETLLVHRRMPACRIASSLSPVQVLVTMFYGGFLRLDPRSPRNPNRDRFVASKGHGSIAMYPILADLGFFPSRNLLRAGEPGNPLGVIPDPAVRGIETVNGSLGHGLGVGCGMAVALDRQGCTCRVFVLAGDGELNEGSVWEAVMFAGHHRLGRLVLVIDANGAGMLNVSRKILDLQPIDEKLRAFGWRTITVPGHDLRAVHAAFSRATHSRDGRPCAIIADTVKGKGVPELEKNPLSHVCSLSHARIDELLRQQ